MVFFVLEKERAKKGSKKTKRYEMMRNSAGERALQKSITRHRLPWDGESS
ncbi:MAG: hypothetical protein LBF22_07920 [Deltaproteobacteria bacterium]|jgi:hypothetical protein|nr:hypothetical protein [Deltaproteobacteria bacterium]